MKKLIKDLELWEVDYLVAKAEGLEARIINRECIVRVNEDWRLENYEPTTSPLQAWHIIEREFIKLSPQYPNGWFASIGMLVSSCGKTSLEAAMRCYVASKFGDEAEI